MEKIKLVCCVLGLVLCLNVVCCQYVQSPCPDVFDYDSDGATIYGKIVLRPSAPVSQLVLRINFTVTAQLYSNYVGRIDAEDNTRLLQKYNRGVPVSYRVHFPVTSPLPRLTAITVNGDTICYGPGDVPRPNQYVTTLSLQHTSFLQGGAAPAFYPQHHSPDPVLNFVGQFGDDAQVFTYNNIDNNNSWNNLTSSRPSYQQTTRPYNQYDGYDDRSPRPSFDRHQDRPTFMQTRPQVYEPVTQAPRPVQDTYYQQTTEAPRPTQRPTQRPPAAPSNDECGVVAGGNEKVPLIYNGSPYTRGDLPWLVAIYKSKGGTLSFICGGTLISNRHVITAAHCMQLRTELSSIKDFVVKVGVYNLNDWSDDITVTRTLIAASIHESYNATTLENDILVFTFNKRVEFNTYIRPACLWNGNTDLTRIVGASGVVAGWGDQGTGTKVGEPHMVRIPIVSTAVCRASKPQFHWLTSQKTLCAGDRKGAGPCRGDSGGGLYLLDGGKWRLRGVVSISLRPQNGDTTCNLNEYIVFTDTAQYLTWIRSVMAENYYD
ncbi:serine protease gd-like isoform X2 [Anticarsia gemmatalis]|uniref:serine protease gd-like isoform X2 n=1 Tax=Anticarsia gemmatalis TaxID=129554 RepID=UPI003F771FA5